ncbi:MAG: hypothetical protein ACLFPD_07550 [Desulfosudaceae bacterium]
MPIIAVTASAVSGDRESFLAAGMDDYIAKPIQQKDLQQLLGRWAGMSGSSTPTVGKQNPGCR